MTHYLSHMAALAVNRTPVVQPRLASRFEGSADAIPAEDIQERVADAPVASPAAPRRDVSDPVAQQRVETGTPPEVANVAIFPVPLLQSQPVLQIPAAATEPVTQAVHQPEVLVQELIRERIHEQPLLIATPTRQHQVTPTHEQPAAAQHKEQSFFTEIRHEVAAPSIAPASQPANGKPGARQETAPTANKTPLIQTRIATPEAGAQPESQQHIQSTETTAHAPSIQVSIGRIEIRANPASNAQSPKPQVKSSTLSLDDYLKQRKGDR